MVAMPRTRPRRAYHHGDLRRALLREATRAIRTDGPDGLTLRDVDRRLGVSRTALYRHFADKSALLASVAREGFQRFSRQLQEAWDVAGGGLVGFRRWGGLCAVRHREPGSLPDHVRPIQDLCSSDAVLAGDASASFQVLVDALVSLQRAGTIGAGNPEELGRYIWATMHGVAMLAIDGQLGSDGAAADSLTKFAIARLRTAIAQ
jgi:AcrR family transcriptional regulator